MILSNINQISQEIKLLPEKIQKAIDYLKETDFSKLENKTYPLEGDKMFVVIQEYQTEPKKEKGMGASRRQAIQEASILADPDGIIVWMEPEKADFVSSLRVIASKIKNSSLDLVIPRRTSLNSYPLFQRYTESVQNEAFRLLTGERLDIVFGPRVFRPSIVPFFLDYKGEHGDRWDSIYIPVLRAIKAGKSVASFAVNFTYPQEQKEAEEENFAMLERRIDQLNSLVEAMKKECKALGITP